MDQTFFENDVAIIATACVLPGAKNPTEFWQNCLEEKNFFAPVSSERIKDYLLSDKKDLQQDRIYSNLACEIARVDYENYLALNDLDESTSNRLMAYAHEGVRQLLEQILPADRRKRIDFVLGCMNPDADHQSSVLSAYRSIFIDEVTVKFANGRPAVAAAMGILAEQICDVMIEDGHGAPEHFFVSHTLEGVARKYGLKGEHFVVDSACASSLTALDLCIQRLKLHQTDLAFSGGIESNLGHGPYIIFSKVGALATKKSLPFDHASEGLVQGEGTVMFALKRIADAIRDGDKIQGVIRAITGGSDGRAASLFQPNVAGQMMVYEKNYGDDRRLDYLEAHGTGTDVGDQTEVESISKFFGDFELPVGSVKSLIGHTKGAAGGAGLLKCLSILKTHTVPGSSYLRSSKFDDIDGKPYVNKTPVTLTTDHPLRLGINSFGFGGTNYHLLLEEFKPNARLLPAPSYNERFGIVASAKMNLDNFQREDFLQRDFPMRLPPKSIAAIDKTQLAALLTSWECIRQLGGNWHFLPKNKIAVVSACTLCLDQVFDIVYRLAYEMIAFAAETEQPGHPVAEEFRAYIEQKVKIRYAPLNEDAATGVLNNVIAGRVCNLFDLYGRSYNIDKDLASIPVALAAVKNELAVSPDQLFIVIGVEEENDPQINQIVRKSVVTRIITSESFAIENDIPLLLKYEIRSETSHAD